MRGITGQYRRFAEMAAASESADDRAKGSIRRTLNRGRSIAVFALLDANDHLIGRFAPDLPEQWPLEEFPWIPAIEAAHPEIKAEVERYLARRPMPHVAEVSGLDPHSDEGQQAAPVEGAWRTVILWVAGKWIDETARQFPKTVEVTKDVKGVMSIGFTGLDPHSHLDHHVGPNRGALRYQLPVIVPGEYGDCRIRIGEDMVRWREGESVVFDLSVDHEAWNDSEAFRVLLMLEIRLPLRFPLRMVNALAQYSYRFHPSYRGMADRIRRLELAEPAAA